MTVEAAALDLPAAANFTLSSRKAELRLQVRNTSDTTLRTIVRFRSAKLKFDRPRQLLEIPANASAEVVVPVEARSNGRFPVSVQLLTPRGDLALGEPVTITANVSAIADFPWMLAPAGAICLVTLGANLVLESSPAAPHSDGRDARLDGRDARPTAS